MLVYPGILEYCPHHNHTMIENVRNMGLTMVI
jgi:hypothetical protein